MAGIVNWVKAFAESIGGPGLFFVAFLDSSFLSLPEINDLLVIAMVRNDTELMPYYALMATLGSVAGCLVLYVLGRRGGDALIRRRFGGPRLTRAMELSKRYGILAVAIPAILPPPAPFKVFVLLAGVAQGSGLAVRGRSRGGSGVSVLCRRLVGGPVRRAGGSAAGGKW